MERKMEREVKKTNKKILILTNLLIFSCSSNFCMQSDEKKKIIKSPKGKWEVRIVKSSNKRPSCDREIKIAQVVNTTNGEILRKYELADKLDEFPRFEKLVQFSLNERYIGFKALRLENCKLYHGKLIVLDLKNGEEIIPFYQEGNQLTLQHFIFSPDSRFIAAIMHLENDQLEYPYKAKIFDLKLKEDITEKIDNDFYKQESRDLMFSPKSKYLLTTNLICTNIYSTKFKKKIITIAGNNQRNIGKKKRINATISQGDNHIAYHKLINHLKMNKKKIEVLDLKTKKKYPFEFNKTVKNFFFISNNLLKIELDKKNYKIFNLKSIKKLNA